MNLNHTLRLIILSCLVFAMTPAIAEDEEFQEALQAAKQRDLPYAIELWRSLADRGHAKAQYHLGVLYRKGLGVEKDLDKSYMWFRRAAEKGPRVDVC